MLLLLCNCPENRKCNEIKVKYSNIPGKKLTYIGKDTYAEVGSERQNGQLYKIAEVRFVPSISDSISTETSWILLEKDRQPKIKIYFPPLMIYDQGSSFKEGKPVEVFFDNRGNIVDITVM